MKKEGLIQYQLKFDKTAIQLPLEWQKLNAWRRTLVDYQVLGQDPKRYLGLGFGNVSLRLSDRQFIITASQTGNIANLQQKHYCLVTNWDIAQNTLWAKGLLPPSSEALTHAQIYQLDSQIKAVCHGHSPKLWHFARQNPKNFLFTSASAEYGTVAMAKEFARLNQEKKLKQGKIVILLGHEDGFISFANNLDLAGQTIINQLKTI